MIITQKALPRRAVLRGLGVTLALPMLDAMVPALAKANAGTSPARVGFFYGPNGMFLENFHPAGTGDRTLV